MKFSPEENPVILAAVVYRFCGSSVDITMMADIFEIYDHTSYDAYYALDKILNEKEGF